MSAGILSLVLLAALTHSVWNIILKSSHNSETASWLQMVFSTIWLLPFLIPSFSVPAAALPTLIFSGLMQGIYYFLLGKCYKLGNLSVVYPFVRGCAPLFVALFSFVLGREHLTLQTMLGLLLIVCGIYLVNMPDLHLSSILAPVQVLIHEKNTRICLLIGVSIAAYTISDKQNVLYCEPLTVYYIISLIPSVLLAPYFLHKHTIRKELAGIGTFRILAISVLTFCAYDLVLVAMKYTEATYISSIREISVLFVVIYTSLREHDSAWMPKVIGAFIIFAGIFAVAYFS